jgi:hypothetical protein
MFPGLARLNKIARMNGHINVGGAPGDREESLDYCVFHHSGISTPNALFDSDFINDYQHRDYSCNALYYDVHNKLIVDPSHCGIADAEERRLSSVWHEDYVTPHNLGKISLRLFKFMLRGYQPTAACIERTLHNLTANLRAIRPQTRARYIHRQLIRNSPLKAADTVAHLEQLFRDLDVHEVWRQCIRPLTKLMSTGG